MEIRKLKISPGDEARLLELLKVHEKEVDALSDEELDEAERQNSEQLSRLLGKRKEKVLPFRIPVKSSAAAAALFAAAAALLFVQLENQQSLPAPSQLVIKGNDSINAIDCEIRLTGDGSKFVDADHRYHVKVFKGEEAVKNKVSLKLDCDPKQKSFVVHLGTKQAGDSNNLLLITSNLAGEEAAEVFKTLQENPGLTVAVTAEKLPQATKKIPLKNSEVLWSDTIPFTFD